MSRGRRPAGGGEDASEALRLIRDYIAANNLTAKSMGYYSGTSEASVWRALNTSPPRWTDSFTKIHEFVVRQSSTAGPTAPAQLMKAVAEASKGRKRATSALLRAIADMLDEGVI